MVWYCFKCQEAKSRLPESLISCPDCRSIRHYKNIRLSGTPGPESSTYIADFLLSRRNFKLRTSRRQSEGMVGASEKQPIVRRRSSYTGTSDNANNVNPRKFQIIEGELIKSSQGRIQSFGQVQVQTTECHEKNTQDEDPGSEDSIGNFSQDIEYEKNISSLPKNTEELCDGSTGDEEAWENTRSRRGTVGRDTIIDGEQRHIKGSQHDRRSSWTINQSR
ncbi:hypothetical protein EV356DRAFT_506875 [Viridothelium virens]|uniref:Uncharacterized protein n=1 Tax=Viridothelium virens TaxID=1048519 RepID=A0A6A6H0X5_VIRVR|nr:hypothetical protein EV356DRAFT_506875 [Viridothelium virens]